MDAIVIQWYVNKWLCIRESFFLGLLFSPKLNLEKENQKYSYTNLTFPLRKHATFQIYKFGKSTLPSNPTHALAFKVERKFHASNCTFILQDRKSHPKETRPRQGLSAIL